MLYAVVLSHKNGQNCLSSYPPITLNTSRSEFSIAVIVNIEFGFRLSLIVIWIVQLIRMNIVVVQILAHAKGGPRSHVYARHIRAWAKPGQVSPQMATQS
jgi:hypothetical protein